MTGYRLVRRENHVVRELHQHAKGREMFSGRQQEQAAAAAAASV